MLAALIAGQRDPTVLAGLARTRMRGKRAELEQAFTGYFTDHHAALLTKMLARIDGLSADIADLDATVEQMTASFIATVVKLDEVPGVGRVAAATILAEIGPDMSRFPTPAHLCAWARFAPGTKESAGKRSARAQPGTATATWPRFSVRQPSAPAGPTPSSASAIGASPAGAAARRPSSPSVAPSW